MATPLTASAALKGLRGAGLSVRTYGDWQTHNRNHKGAWGPVNGVMVHHTANYQSTAQMVALCRTGYSGLPGPLYQMLVDKSGTLHLIGWGRANHAGLGDDDVLEAVIREDKNLPAANEENTDGNSRFYAIAGINRGDGRDPWPDEQVDTIARAAAALCRAHGWNERSVIGHRDWQRGKIDPRGPGMSVPLLQNHVRAALRPAPAPPAPRTLEQRVSAIERRLRAAGIK